MGFLSFLAAIVAALIATVLADELRTLLPWLTVRALQMAVRIAPTARRDRFREEWAAHLNDVPGGYTKLAVALGFIVASVKLTCEERSRDYSAQLAETAPTLSKRMVDVGITLPLFAAALPLMMALIVLSVCCNGPGPVLYTRTCIGRGGTLFRQLKFRTMVMDAKAAAPRLTLLGRFLRRTGLDELPQLLNVLRGEMSLIGPHPKSLASMPVLAAALSDYELRHTVKPGITGWAQVNLPYNAPEAEKLRHDIYYVKNRTLALDLLILVRTLCALSLMNMD